MAKHKKKAFLVVGHSHWGKSETLKALTNDSRRVRYFEIASEWYFIRRMSNDDTGDEKMIKFIDSKISRLEHNLIMAFCPKFERGRKGKQILDKLRREFELHFFILKNNYKQDQEITENEIETMQKYCKTPSQINIYERKAEASARAKALNGFIVAHSK